MIDRCHCGRPLHYVNPEAKQLMDEIIARKGPNIVVTVSDGRSFSVPRHYIALHGLKEQDVPNLGFEEVASK